MQGEPVNEEGARQREASKLSLRDFEVSRREVLKLGAVGLVANLVLGPRPTEAASVPANKLGQDYISLANIQLKEESASRLALRNLADSVYVDFMTANLYAVGSVGIGTTTPQAKLHVTTSNPAESGVPAGALLRIGGKNDDYNDQYINFRNPRISDGDGMQWWSADIIFGRYKNLARWALKETHGPPYGSSIKDIIAAYLVDNGGYNYIDKVVIAPSGGKVGIGTGDPTQTLHVHGETRTGSITVTPGWNWWHRTGGDAAICCDSGGYKALMIVGSDQGQGYGRWIRMWDYVSIHGTLSKGAGSFDIIHPDPEKARLNYRLRHSFVESPTRGDNLYRYQVEVTGGEATIKLPSYFGWLNENVQVWISPLDHFGRAYGEVDEKSTSVRIVADHDGVYNVLIIGTRKDKIAKDWFDAKGVEYIEKTPLYGLEP